MQRKMCFPWTEKSNEVLIWNYWTVILLPCYWPWSCLMDRKVQGGLSHSVWKKEKDVWGTTYCIHHGRKVMLNTLLMFKTVSAIIFSWEKADWSPSFISSVSTKRAVSFHLVCWNLHSEQEVWSQAKCSLPLLPKRPSKDSLHLAKQVKVLGDSRLMVPLFVSLEINFDVINDKKLGKE